MVSAPVSEPCCPLLCLPCETLVSTPPVHPCLPPSLPPSLPACLSVETGKSHGFLHSVADSMRESSGIARHDAPKPSVQLPEGEAPEPGTVEKIKASISGVAGASQVLGWGAHGSKGEKVKVEGSAPSVEMGAPSVEAGAAGADASVSAPSVDVDASAAVPSVEGDVSVPSASAEGGLKLPSGSADVGGCEFLFCLLFREDPPVVRKGAFCSKHVSCVWLDSFVRQGRFVIPGDEGRRQLLFNSGVPCVVPCR